MNDAIKHRFRMIMNSCNQIDEHNPDASGWAKYIREDVTEILLMGGVDVKDLQQVPDSDNADE